MAVRLVATGQHRDLARAAVDLGPYETRHLDVSPMADPFTYAHSCASAYAAGNLPRPAMIIVQGDTASAYGGALAAADLDLPLAHVEAGLRSHDRANPWPEEDFRIAIDRLAALHFAPTELAARHLREEGCDDSVHVVGNSGVDALKALLATLPPRTGPRGDERRLLITCHRREHWGEPLADLIAATIDLAERHPRLHIDVALHPNPAIGQAWRRALERTSPVRLLAPLTHRQMLLAMRSADLILSDSGGMQEEAPYVGTPLFILRRRTERPEGIASGQLKLIGIERQRIVEEVEHFFASPRVRRAMINGAEPYGDGRTGPRIAAIIAERLALSSLPARPRQERPAASL